MPLLRAANILASLIFIVLAVSNAEAAGPCVAQLRGFGFAILQDGETQVVYRISSNDNRWQLKPLGWHANAVVWCRNCGGSNTNIAALIWLGGAEGAVRKPDDRIGQDSSTEIFSWPLTRYDHAVYVGDPREVSIGEFPGWLSHLVATSKGVLTHDIYRISASDKCLGLYVRIETSHSPNTDRLVSEFLASLHVSRKKLSDDPELRRYMEKSKSKPVWPLSPRPSFEAFRREIEKLK